MTATIRRRRGPLPGGVPGVSVPGELARRLADRDAAAADHLQRRRDEDARRRLDRLVKGTRMDRRGAKGLAAGRLWGRMRLQAHTAPSRMLKAAYPWIMHPGLGVPGAYIGSDLFSMSSFLFDPFELYAAGVISSPNIAHVGEIGTGKSALMKSVILRLLVFGIAFSWVQVKPEYEDLCTALGIEPLRIGPGQSVRLNPLAEVLRHPGQNDQEYLAGNRGRRLTLLEGMLEVSLRRPLLPVERSVIEWSLDAATGADEPANATLAPVSLPTLLAQLINPQRWQHRAVELGLPAGDVHDEARDVRLELAGMLSGPLRGMFDTTEARNKAFDFRAAGTVVDLSRIRTNERVTVLAMVCAQSAMEAELMHPDAPRRLVGYDEAWMSMRYLPLLRRYQEQWKLSRLYGIANWIAFHRFTDLDAIGDAGSESRSLAAGLLEDTGIKIAHRQGGSVALRLAGELMKLSDVQEDLLRYLKVGVALWKIGDHTAVVKHRLSSVEQPLVYTDSRMKVIAGIDDITDEEWDDLLEQGLAVDTA
jgi:hypothetical protein